MIEKSSVDCAIQKLKNNTIVSNILNYKNQQSGNEHIGMKEKLENQSKSEKSSNDPDQTNSFLIETIHWKFGWKNVKNSVYSSEKTIEEISNT